MQLHIDEISRRVQRAAHAVVLPDRAGGHTTDKPVAPKTMTLIFLPSRSPELTPGDNLWRDMRQNWLSNRGFETYDAIINASRQAWNNLIEQPETITSIGTRISAHIGQPT